MTLPTASGAPLRVGLIKVAVIEHIALFEIVLAQPFAEVEEPLHHVAPLGNVPDFPRGQLQPRIVVKHLGPIFKIGKRGAQEGGVVLADAEAIHGHVTVLMPEDLPWLADVFRMF